MTPEQAYAFFQQNGYWQDEAQRTAGLQHLSQLTAGQSSMANQLNPYAQQWNGATQTYQPAGTVAPMGAPGSQSTIGGYSPTGTTSAPTATAGTSTAQSATNPYTAAAAPNPWGGNAFLTNTAQQGLSAGMTPFDPQWLDRLGQNLYGQASQHFLENVNPALNSAAIMAGGYGGDRAALAKGVAADRVAQGVTNSLAPLYQQGYESSLNRNLGAGQVGLQGLLGLGGLDINRYNAQTNAAAAAAGAAGTPVYTNPWLSGLGAFTSLYGLFN